MAYACLPRAGLRFEVHPETSVSFGGLSDAEIEAMIQERQAARKPAIFQADRIRNELQAQGIALIDSPDGVTRWHRN